MTDLLSRCRSHILATLSLLELEAREHPERRTGHLVKAGRELVGEIEAMLEASDALSH